MNIDYQCVQVYFNYDNKAMWSMCELLLTGKNMSLTFNTNIMNMKFQLDSTGNFNHSCKDPVAILTNVNKKGYKLR